MRDGWPSVTLCNTAIVPTIARLHAPIERIVLMRFFISTKRFLLCFARRTSLTNARRAYKKLCWFICECALSKSVEPCRGKAFLREDERLQVFLRMALCAGSFLNTPSKNCIGDRDFSSILYACACQLCFFYWLSLEFFRCNVYRERKAMRDAISRYFEAPNVWI